MPQVNDVGTSKDYTSPGAGGDALTKKLIGQVAGYLGISPAKAKQLIVAAHKEGGTWVDAATAVLSGGDYSGGTGGGDSSSSGSSSGGSSSGGSSSGGGGATGPSPQALANAKASYANMLRAWNIPLTPAMRNLINRAVTGGMGSQQFLQVLRQTRDYAKAFPGLVRKNGTLRMTESQFMSGYQTARDFAHSVGRNLSVEQYGLAIKNGNSPSEVKEKMQALDILKTNRGTLENFSEYLLAKGIVNKPLQKNDLLAFVMRQGPKRWEQEWDTASQAAELARLEIDVGKPKTGSDISYKELQKLQKGLPTGEAPDYKAIAGALQSLPASKLYGYGLTKKDIVTLGYGGKGAKEIAEVATRALAQYRTAVTEPGAQPQLTQSGTGTQVLTGRRPVQSTE